MARILERRFARSLHFTHQRQAQQAERAAHEDHCEPRPAAFGDAGREAGVLAALKAGFVDGERPRQNVECGEGIPGEPEQDDDSQRGDRPEHRFKTKAVLAP